MNRIVVAFPAEAQRARVCEILEGAGIPVRLACRGGAEAIRKVREMGGGIVLCSFHLPDMTAADLAYDVCGEALVLVAAPPEQLSFCTGDTFRLPTPLSRSELAASVRMLMQLDEQRARAVVPQRTEDERRLVQQAKELLMGRYHITEEEAHRYIQQRSMASGRKMADTARQVLEMGAPLPLE